MARRDLPIPPAQDGADLEPAAAGRGRAKLILFGEHAVVWGEPAVAISLPVGAKAEARFSVAPHSQLRLKDGRRDKILAAVDARPPSAEASQDAALQAAFYALLGVFEPPSALDVQVDLEIPTGVGMGSSAALAVAAARAIAQLLERPDLVEEAVWASERVFHGNPSGLDQQMASARSGLYIWARQQPEETWAARPLKAPPLTLAVCQAAPGASTAQMVELVAAKRAREPALVDQLHSFIGHISRTAHQALSQADWARAGELMDLNHGALVALGVSTLQLDLACHAARSAGALGAKLTGAGGGGCVVALTPDGAGPVLEAWRQRGWSGFEFHITG